MIHSRQSVPTAPATQGRSAGGLGGGLRRRNLVSAALLATALGSLACGDDGPTNPGALRFGQVGRVEVELQAPLSAPPDQLAAGLLRQHLTWSSSGAWTLEESMSYRGLPGDQHRRTNPAQPGLYAGGYASLVTQLNEFESQKLFIDELPQGGDPDCGPTQTRVRFSMYDDVRADSASWVRCADGSLANLTPLGADPDVAAARVVLAVVLARNQTLGEAFQSVYAGSVPFGTLDRGEDTPAGLTEPTVFLDRTDWLSFWRQHAGNEAGFPEVDFDEEMVVVAAVGTREEAGDSVEVRRILRVDQGTVTEIFERVPGDFCSPAARSHTPFHIVVAPRMPAPLRFADIRVELVPCGN